MNSPYAKPRYYRNNIRFCGLIKTPWENILNLHLYPLFLILIKIEKQKKNTDDYSFPFLRFDSTEFINLSFPRCCLISFIRVTYYLAVCTVNRWYTPRFPSSCRNIVPFGVNDKNMSHRRWRLLLLTRYRSSLDPNLSPSHTHTHTLYVSLLPLSCNSIIQHGGYYINSVTVFPAIALRIKTYNVTPYELQYY